MAVNIKKDYGGKNRKPDMNALVYGKVPPQDTVLEEAVLGVLLLEKDRIDLVATILNTPECFYEDGHQKIYKAIITTQEKGVPVDMMTVIEQLRKTEELEIVGGAYRITKLTMDVVSGAHVEDWARIIKEKFIQREIIRISSQGINDAYSDATDAFDLLDTIERNLYGLRASNIKKDVVKSDKVVKQVLEEVDEQIKSNITFSGVPTGHPELDSLTRGWQKTHLIILAARPAVGKTAFAVCLAMYAGIYAPRRYPGAFFSMEMKSSDLVKRMISASSGISFSKILTPIHMNEAEKKLFAEHAKIVSSAPIYWDDTAGLGMPELRSKARKMKKEYEIEWLIIDYLQLMQGDSNDSRNREAEVSKISRELKMLAMELEIPIIALSQLNRSVEGRAVKVYKLSDLRESGSIEQDADMVMFLHTPSKEEAESKTELLKVAGVFIEKLRNGSTGKVIYNFDKVCQRWEEPRPFEVGSSGPQPIGINSGIMFDKKIPTNTDGNDDLPF